MVKMSMPYVKMVRKRNRTVADKFYYYSVPPGTPRLKIPFDPATQAVQFVTFVEQRNDAAARRRREETERSAAAAQGTFHHLLDAYLGNPDRQVEASEDFLMLAAKTRSDYRGLLERVIRPRFGPFRVCDLESEMVLALRDSFSATPYYANQVVRTLSTLMSFACARSATFGVTVNPCLGKKKKFGVKKGVRARRAFWAPADEAAFVRRAWRMDWEMVKAIYLFIYTGQRPGDCLAMDMADYDGSGRVRVTLTGAANDVAFDIEQSKTGARVMIPAHKSLVRIIEIEKRRRLKEGRVGGTILHTAAGEPFKWRYFCSRWDKVVAATGLQGLQRRDLRRTAVVRLAEAGCQVPQIAAITGHSLRSVDNIMEHYFVRTFPMAQTAIARLEDHRAAARAKRRGDKLET